LSQFELQETTASTIPSSDGQDRSQNDITSTNGTAVEETTNGKAEFNLTNTV